MLMVMWWVALKNQSAETAAFVCLPTFCSNPVLTVCCKWINHLDKVTKTSSSALSLPYPTQLPNHFYLSFARQSAITNPFFLSPNVLPILVGCHKVSSSSKKHVLVKCPLPQRMYLWYVVFTYIRKGGNCGTQLAPPIFGRDLVPANSITPLHWLRSLLFANNSPRWKGSQNGSTLLRPGVFVTWNLLKAMIDRTFSTR